MKFNVRYFLLINLILFPAISIAQLSQWLPVQLKNGNWTFQKPDGQYAFAEEFDAAFPFTPCGIAPVVSELKHRYIFADGTFVKSLDAYDSAIFSGRRDLFFIWKKGKAGIWSGNAQKELVSPQCDEIKMLNTKRLMDFPSQVSSIKTESFLDFVAAVNKKWALIQIQIFPNDPKKPSTLLNQTKAIYSSIDYYLPQFMKGIKFKRMFQVEVGPSQNLGLLDENGKELVPGSMKVKNLTPINFASFTKQQIVNQAPVFIQLESEDGQLGLVDIEKHTVWPCKYQIIRCLETQGPAIFYLESGKSMEVYFSTENKFMSVPSKEVDVNANYKIISVMNSKKYYDLYSYSGQKIWSNWTFANGTWLANDFFAFVGDNGKFGLMQGYKTLLIPNQYEDINYLYSNQYFGVKKNSKWSVYDILKNELTDLDYSKELKNAELRNPSKKIGKGLVLVHARQDDSLTLYLVENLGYSGYEGLVNDSGRWIVKSKINEIIRVKNNCWLVLSEFLGKSILLERDSKGKYKTTPVQNLNGTFDKQIGENLLCIKSDPKTLVQYFDRATLKPLPFLSGSVVSTVEDDLISFKRLNATGFYNPNNGVWIEKGFYSKCEGFDGLGYALTLSNNQMGFADKNGSILVLQQAPPFENRVAYMKMVYTDGDNGFQSQLMHFTEHLDQLKCYDEKGKLLYSNDNKTDVQLDFVQNGFVKEVIYEQGTNKVKKTTYKRLTKQSK